MNPRLIFRVHSLKGKFFKPPHLILIILAIYSSNLTRSKLTIFVKSFALDEVWHNNIFIRAYQSFGEPHAIRWSPLLGHLDHTYVQSWALDGVWVSYWLRCDVTNFLRALFKKQKRQILKNGVITALQGFNLYFQDKVSFYEFLNDALLKKINCLIIYFKVFFFTREN